ncbi:MAG: hypothetical protein WA384_20795 [Rhodomicrobium sp.]
MLLSADEEMHATPRCRHRCFVFAAQTVWAGQSLDAKRVQQELAAKVPSTWQIHVTQRDGHLLGFVTPPYQEAFNLWYEPQKLQEKLQSLCPAPQDAIWGQLPAAMELTLQPTVGGKSADSLRISCLRAS